MTPSQPHESSGCVRHGRPDCDACFEEAVQSPHVESECLFNGCAGCMPPLGVVVAPEALQQVSRVVSMAQGMCTDERPHEEINVILDVAQRVLDAYL